MTALDILTLIVVGGAAFRGVSRGFTFEVLTLMAWVMAIVAVRLFHDPLSVLLTDLIGTSGGAAMAALAILFAIPYIIGRMIANHMGRGVRSSSIAFVDRVLGAVFGALKGLVIMAFAFLVVTLVYDTIYTKRAERPEWMTASRTYPLLDSTSRGISDFLEKRREGGDFCGEDSAAPSNLTRD